MKNKVFKGILVVLVLLVAGIMLNGSGVLTKDKGKSEVKKSKINVEKISKNETYTSSLQNPEFMKKLKKEVYAEYGWDKRPPNKYEKKIFNELNECSSKKGLIDQDLVTIFQKTRKAGIDLQNIIRPFADVIFDYDNKYKIVKTKNTEDYYLIFFYVKDSAIIQIGYTLKKEALPLLKKLLKVEIDYKKYINKDYNSNSAEYAKFDFKLKTIKGIYLCGDKKTAWEEMVKINKKGIPFIFRYVKGIKNGVNQYDQEIKPYLMEIVKINDDLVKINAAHCLMYFGEKKLALKIAKEMKSKKLVTKKRDDRNWAINYYVDKILKKAK